MDRGESPPKYHYGEHGEWVYDFMLSLYPDGEFPPKIKKPRKPKKSELYWEKVEWAEQISAYHIFDRLERRVREAKYMIAERENYTGYIHEHNRTPTGEDKRLLVLRDELKVRLSEYDEEEHNKMKENFEKLKEKIRKTSKRFSISPDGLIIDNKDERFMEKMGLISIIKRQKTTTSSVCCH